METINAKPLKMIYATNKTGVCFLDDTWSMDLLDLNDNGRKILKALDGS